MDEQSSTHFGSKVPLCYQVPPWPKVRNKSSHFHISTLYWMTIDSSMQCSRCIAISGAGLDLCFDNYKEYYASQNACHL